VFVSARTLWIWFQKVGVCLFMIVVGKKVVVLNLVLLSLEIEWQIIVKINGQIWKLHDWT